MNRKTMNNMLNASIGNSKSFTQIYRDCINCRIKIEEQIPEKLNYDSRYLILCIEELSELQKELTKTLRNKADHDGIKEEIADVMLCLLSLMQMFDISKDDIRAIMSLKQDIALKEE